jgi:hypothetical protein
LTEIKRTIQAVEKHLIFAEAQALNAVGKAIQTALTDEIKRVFDRPTPLTQRSVKFWPAGRKDKFTGERILEAVVFIQDELGNKQKNPPARYLRPQVEGGKRDIKQFEFRMMAGHGGHGRTLFPGHGFLVPTRTTPLDKYGNVSGPTIIRMLSDLKAFNTSGFNANVTKRSKIKRGYGRRKATAKYEFVFGQLKNKPGLGIWRRDNATQEITPYFRWKPEQKGYKKRFKIHDIAQEVATEQFPLFFKDQLKYAIRTAR